MIDNLEVNKIFNRIKFEIAKATEKTLWGREPTSKKIKRRLSYEVSFWYDGNRETKYFHSAKKMRKFVNGIHEFTMMDIPEITIEKTWCYREHHPRHKWWYYSTDPNKGCLIGNNRGGINGWTKNVYGKVIEVL